MNFPAYVEAELIDWYQAHHEIYDKTDAGYRDTKKIALLYQEKADEMAMRESLEYVTAEVLKHWFAG